MTIYDLQRELRVLRDQLNRILVVIGGDSVPGQAAEGQIQCDLCERTPAPISPLWRVQGDMNGPHGPWEHRCTEMSEWRVMEPAGEQRRIVNPLHEASRQAREELQPRFGEQRRCPACGSTTCEGTHMARERDYSAVQAHMAKVWAATDPQPAEAAPGGERSERDLDSHPPENLTELIQSFEEWLDCTGAISRGHSWYWELRSFFDEDVKRLLEKKTAAPAISEALQRIYELSAGGPPGGSLERIAEIATGVLSSWSIPAAPNDPGEELRLLRRLEGDVRYSLVRKDGELNGAASRDLLDQLDALRAGRK